MEIKGFEKKMVTAAPLHPDGGEQTIVTIVPSHPDGGFIGHMDGHTPIGVANVFELVIREGVCSEEDMSALEAGDREVLTKYVVPDEGRPGVYRPAEDCYAWLGGRREYSSATKSLVEYVPFVEGEQ